MSKERKFSLEQPMLMKLAVVNLVYTVFVIVWGAFVRKTHSGAGCGDHWPLCNGQVVPFQPEIETLIELTHRLTSGLALLISIALFVGVMRRLVKGHPARTSAGLALLFIIIEALLGAGIVIFGLVESDSSVTRAVVIAVHLANTYVLLFFQTLACLHLALNRKLHLVNLLRSGWLLSFLAGFIVVGSFGAISALGNTLFPAESLMSGMTAHKDMAAHFLERLKVIHPVLAVVVGLGAVTYIQTRLSREGKIPSMESRWGNITCLLILLNLGLGVLDVILLAPTWLSLTHLVFADAIWVSFVIFAACHCADLHAHEAPERARSSFSLLRWCRVDLFGLKK